MRLAAFGTLGSKPTFAAILPNDRMWHFYDIRSHNHSVHKASGIRHRNAARGSHDH